MFWISVCRFDLLLVLGLLCLALCRLVVCLLLVLRLCFLIIGLFYGC